MVKAKNALVVCCDFMDDFLLDDDKVPLNYYPKLREYALNLKSSKWHSRYFLLSLVRNEATKKCEIRILSCARR